VPGLSPENVSVIDTNGNLLNRPRPGASGEGAQSSEIALEYRKSVEHDVQSKVASTLDPLLGPDHFRIGVSAEVDLTSGEQSEETFDPQKSVMTSSQRTDDGPALAAASGIPGTASNLPPPVSKPATSSTNFARHTENITYQSSRLVKLTRSPQGTVKRLSLSVLVDHGVRWEGGKRIVEPPSADKLKVIRDVVAAATGLDTNRGDQLVVEAFPFEATLSAEQPTLSAPSAQAPSAPSVQWPPWLTKRIGKAPVAAWLGGGILVLVIAATVLLRRRGKAKNGAHLAAAALAAAQTTALGPSPDDVQRQVEGRMAQRSADQARLEAEALMSLKIPAVATKKTEVLSKHIAAEANSDPAALAQVVRTWISG
jgi:flagellar M-ring protein FliF